MAEISFRSAWDKQDAALMRDAREFWLGLGGAVTPGEVDERLPQLCALAYADGKVVGLSTAYIYDYPRLRSRFAFYRTNVAEGFRRQRLAVKLCAYSRDRLQEWAGENPEVKLQGLFIVLQAKEFKKDQRVPLARRGDLDFVLIGYTPGGYQMRVVWFEGATVE